MIGMIDSYRIELIHPRRGLSGLCAVLTILGYPDQGIAQGREALNRAEKLSWPLAMATALGNLGLNYLYCWDSQEAWSFGGECDRLSTEQGFAYWAALGKSCCAWALIEQGQVEEGAALMRQAAADAQAIGCRVARTIRLTGLAEAYGKMGRIEEGLALLNEVLALVRSSDEHMYEPETHRLKGELLLLQGEEGEAEACFQRAIDVARQQSAKMWDLRATTSLCRLWQWQGKHRKARKRLAQIYSWFTEGFDTLDLQDAKALLEKLS
jgi:predicted ATPase